MANRSSSQSRWDYIVIGAGSAGCALVHELSHKARGQSILVLEAGGADRSPFIRLQAGAFRACLDHDWGYRSQPDPTRNGTAERWWRGRVLGGCSSINSTIFVRGASTDFDRWSAGLGASHAAGWSAADVMPLFCELEASDQVSALRGHSGPLHIRTVKRPHATTEAFIKSACAAGYPFNPDYNAGSQEGVAYAQLSQRGIWRWSAADAFLKPLLGKGHVELMLNTLVEKVDIKNGRAEGVSFMHKGQRRQEKARNVILSAGAINSPKLLMLSGVGEGEELKRHGIDVVVDLPAVGRNLRDHPLVKAVYRMRVPTYSVTGGLLQKMGFVGNLIRSREGPIVNIFESVAFLRTAPTEPSPDVQLHFIPLGLLPGPDSSYVLAPFPSVSIMINKSHPSSTGRVRLGSADPDAAPIIESQLLREEADLKSLLRGIQAVRKIMQAEPIASLVSEECVPGISVDTVAALGDFVRGNTGIANHPIGTCRMGIGPNAVVGPDLRVRGVENLWVADASIMPDIVSGNTSAACMMIGKKLGRQLGIGTAQADRWRAEESGIPIRRNGTASA